MKYLAIVFFVFAVLPLVLLAPYALGLNKATLLALVWMVALGYPTMLAWTTASLREYASKYKPRVATSLVLGLAAVGFLIATSH